MLNSVFLNVIASDQDIIMHQHGKAMLYPHEQVCHMNFREDTIFVEYPDSMIQEISILEHILSQNPLIQILTIKLISQRRSANHYFFCFQVNDNFIFVRKTMEEIKNITDSAASAIIKADDEIQILKRLNKHQEIEIQTVTFQDFYHDLIHMPAY